MSRPSQVCFFSYLSNLMRQLKRSEPLPATLDRLELPLGRMATFLYSVPLTSTSQAQ